MLKCQYACYNERVSDVDNGIQRAQAPHWSGLGYNFLLKIE